MNFMKLPLMTAFLVYSSNFIKHLFMAAFLVYLSFLNGCFVSLLIEFYRISMNGCFFSWTYIISPCFFKWLMFSLFVKFYDGKCEATSCNARSAKTRR